MLAPQHPVLRVFGSTAELLIARIVTSAREQQTVANLRDTLLPKLISGELRLGDVEKHISVA